MATTGQAIFDLIMPMRWSPKAPLSKVWRFMKAESVPIEQKREFVKIAIERIPMYLEQASWLQEMTPYMDLALKEQFSQKSIEEMQSFFQEMEKILQTNSKNPKRQIFATLAQEPFSEIVQQSSELYEQFISLSIAFLEKFKIQEIDTIAVLLQNTPGEDPLLQEKRRALAFLCAQKLKSMDPFAWLVQEAAQSIEDEAFQAEFQEISLLNSRASSFFLQEIANQIESKPKDPAFYQILEKHMKIAPSIDAKTLLAFMSWLRKDALSPMEEDVFRMVIELLFLSLRSKENSLAEEFLSFIYGDLDALTSTKKFKKRYLPMISKLLQKHPHSIKKEYMQQLARWIALQSTQKKDPMIIESSRELLLLAQQMQSHFPKMFQICLQDLCPGIDVSFNFSKQIMLLRENYLLLLSEFTSEKDIDLSFLSLLEQYLINMHSIFTDEGLCLCACDILTLYIKTHALEKAKSWVQEWMGLQNLASDTPKDFDKFCQHQWSFLVFLTNHYPELIEKSFTLQAVQYLQRVESLFQHPNIPASKITAIIIAGMLSPQESNEIVQVLCPSLDSTLDGGKKLEVLFTSFLAPLLLSPKGKKVNLKKEFLDSLENYFLMMKTRMPFSDELYGCLQVFALLLKEQEYKVGNALEILCPPLNADTDNLEQIFLLNKYYTSILLPVARDCSSFVDCVNLRKLVEYTVLMHERLQSGEISELSRKLVAICTACDQLELAGFLVENVHQKRMQQFHLEKKSIDISEDLVIYLNYLNLAQQDLAYVVLNIDALLIMFKEHKVRNSQQGVLSFEAIISVFVQTVQKIVESGKATPALFPMIAEVSLFLMEEEPISEAAIRLIYYAYQCPWDDFYFQAFLNLYQTLQMKMARQGFRADTLPENVPMVSVEQTVIKVSKNFEESRIKEGGEAILPAVKEYFIFFYAVYRGIKELSGGPYFKKVLVQALEKIIKERKDCLPLCISYALSKFPNDHLSLQELIESTSVSSVEKKHAIAFLSHLIS